MPTVLTIDKYRVVIHTNDHRPAHVHVEGPDGSCVFWLNCPAGPISVREVCGLSLAMVRRLGRAVDEAAGLLCLQWRHVHERY